MIYLQLSEGVVTLFLAGRLLGAQRDQLVDAVGHGSVTKQTINAAGGGWKFICILE